MAWTISVQKAPAHFPYDPSSDARKVAERRKVAFLLNRLHGPGYMRLFSMPSNAWDFESVMGQLGRPLQIIAADYDHWRISQSAAQYALPVLRWRWHEERVRCGEFSALVGMDDKGERVRFANIEVESLTSLRGQDIGDNRRVRRFGDTYKRWTAAWLDFNGPLSKRRLACIRRSVAHFNRRRPVWPLAVTFQRGRETGFVRQLVRAGAKRERMVEAAAAARKLRRVRMVDHWITSSAGRATMQTVVLAIED